MSHLGFFKATIENWYKLDKKLPTRVKEMKEAIRQYNYSKWCGDFDNEDINEVKQIEQEMNKIYKELY